LTRIWPEQATLKPAAAISIPVAPRWFRSWSRVQAAPARRRWHPPGH